MIIGIGGVSTAGKSRLALRLCQFLHSRNKTCRIIDQDDFVLPEEQIPQISGRTDWEIPESINFETFKKAIVEAHEQNDVVLAVGLMVFLDTGINALFDRRIYINVSFETVRKRKNVDLRWSDKPDPEWYVMHIWQSHQKYGKPSAGYEYTTLTGESDIDLQALWGKMMVSA